MRHMQLRILELLKDKEMPFEEMLAALRHEAEIQESDLWAAIAPLLDNGRIEEFCENNKFRLKERELVGANPR